MWEKTERGKWERGKILAEIFWGKWEMVFAQICNSNITWFLNWHDNTQFMGPTESLYLCWCHWVSFLSLWKHPFAVSCFHHFNSNFWVLSDGNRCWKPSQTKNFLWDPHVLKTQLWKLSDMIQKATHPNRSLTTAYM